MRDHHQTQKTTRQEYPWKPPSRTDPSRNVLPDHIAAGSRCAHQPAIAGQSRFMSTRPSSGVLTSPEVGSLFDRFPSNATFKADITSRFSVVPTGWLLLFLFSSSDILNSRRRLWRSRRYESFSSRRARPVLHNSRSADNSG